MRSLFLIVLLFVTACARPPAPVWTELPAADELLARLHAESGRFRSLDAEAGVDLSAAGKSFSSRQFLLLERPDRLRIDVVTGFGQLLLQLASDGDTLEVLLNSSAPGRFLRGPASYENISRFVRIPLAVGDLLPLLLHDPPIIAYRQSRTAERDGELVLSLSGDDKRQELVFNERLQLTGCRYLVGDQLLLAVTYRNFKGEPLFPRKIVIEIPAEESRVTLSIADLQLNTSIHASKFSLQKPENVAVEILP